MATDQGKTSNLGALAAMAELTGKSIPDTGTTIFRPPYTPVAMGALAGRAVGKDFHPTRLTPSHKWAEEQGAVFVEVGNWLRAQWFPREGETHWRQSVDREVLQTRNSVGICDVTTLGKIDVQGADAATFLNMNDRIPSIDVSPVSLRAEIWHAPARRMSPLIAGAALSDCAVRLLERGRITMENVNFPLLAVPFMGGAALRLGRPVAAEWDGVRLATDGKRLCVQGDSEAFLTRLADQMVFYAPADMTGQQEPVMAIAPCWTFHSSTVTEI